MKKEGIYSTRSGYIYIKKEKEFMHTTNIWNKR
jgi:hypothetical protein